MTGCLSSSLMMRCADTCALPASGANALALPSAIAPKTMELKTLKTSSNIPYMENIQVTPLNMFHIIKN